MTFSDRLRLIARNPDYQPRGWVVRGLRQELCWTVAVIVLCAPALVAAPPPNFGQIIRFSPRCRRSRSSGPTPTAISCVGNRFVNDGRNFFVKASYLFRF